MAKNPLHDPLNNQIFVIVNTSRGPGGYPSDGRAYVPGDDPSTRLGLESARCSRNWMREEYENPGIEMYRLIPANIEFHLDGTWEWMPQPNCPVCDKPVSDSDEANSQCGQVIHKNCMGRHLNDCGDCMEHFGHECSMCEDWFAGEAGGSVELYTRCPECQRKYLQERGLSPEFFPLTLRGLADEREGVQPFPFMMATSLPHASRMTRDYAAIYGNLSTALPLVGIYRDEILLAQIDKDGGIYARPVGDSSRQVDEASWVKVSDYAYLMSKNRAFHPDEESTHE